MMIRETAQLAATFTEVFSTAKGAIYQCDDERCWYIDFDGKLCRFDHRCLLKLKKAVYNIDIEQKLLNPPTNTDLEILFICACDHFYVLSLIQVIAFRELLEGAFVMLELNRIINNAVSYSLS